MNKDKNYYMELNWAFEFEKADGGGYYARVKGMPIHSYGDNLQLASDQVLEALELYIDTCLEDNLLVIEPAQYEDFNGRINIRVTKSIQMKLAQIAEREGVSISHLVNDAIVQRYAS